GAADLMESAVADSADSSHTWLLGEQLTQADITTAIAWRFLVHTDCVKLQAADFPSLVRFSARAEDLPEFLACPLT
ncbi:MAG: glutathione S-transferase, partial [Xanthomonadales bacterium]|nr:glutathione S-transferase [Xanthomonadales bacterium]